jgi:pimeloyl-ACP methyl ester carboxylesterase
MTTHVLERDGVRLHYEVHGGVSAKAPLLLTHGYGASSAMWRGNLAALSGDRQVITWDIRGHGRTVTPAESARYTHEGCVADMAAILDACGATVAVIGGLSLGGYLALCFHLARAERVAALLLLDTGPGYNSDRGRERWNAYAESTAEAFERDGLAALADSPEARLGVHDPVGLALAARGLLVQHDASVIQSLSSVGVPTFVVVGADDRPFLEAADYMTAHIPGAAKSVIDGAGHAANLDQPDIFNSVVRAFLEKLE